MPEKLIRVGAYYRMSDERQENSIDRQRSQVEPYAARKGYQIVAEYIDLGIPGDEVEKRKEFCRMLRDAQAKVFDVILCDDKDRFGRFDIIDQGYYVKPLRDAGIWLETVAQGRTDWNSFAGRITDAAMQEAKKIESQATSRRILTLLLMKAQRGEPTGGTAPYGYVFVEDPIVRKRLVPGDERAVAVVRLIFDLFGSRGFSLEEVRAELQARAVPDPKGRPAWNKASIRWILRNRKYVGDLPWNRRHDGKYSEFAGDLVRTHDQRTKPRCRNPEEDWVIKANTHEPLIDRDLFERAQFRLEENRTRTTPLPKGGDFALSGLLICAHCGWRMFAGRDGRDHKGGRLYYCSRYHREGKGACHHNRIREDKLVKCIASGLQQFILNPDVLAPLREELRRRADEVKEDRGTEVEAARRRIGELDRQLQQASRNLAILPEDVLQGVMIEVRKLQAERERLAAQLEQLTSGAARQDAEATLKRAEAYLWRLRDALTAGDPYKVRSVFHELLDRVEVRFNHRQTARQTRCDFAGGLIWLKAESPETTELIGARCRAAQVCNTPIVITSEDYEAA